MRARLYTARGTLGLVDLVDGADVADVVRAMREHRLFITPVEERPREPVATTLPEDKTLEEQREGAYADERQKRRRVRA